MNCYFTMFYCLLDMSCGECDVISLYFMCFSVNELVVICVAYLTVFVNSFRNMFGCGCYFVCLLSKCLVWVEVICSIDCSSSAYRAAT